jgi:TPR repeat protein
MGMRDCGKASEWLQKAARLGDVNYKFVTAREVHILQVVLEGRNLAFARRDLPDDLWFLLARCLDATVWVTPESEVTAESYFRHAERLFDKEDSQSEAVWWYQAAALRGHAEARDRLVKMQLQSTQAITSVFRQID